MLFLWRGSALGPLAEGAAQCAHWAGGVPYRSQDTPSVTAVAVPPPSKREARGLRPERRNLCGSAAPIPSPGGKVARQSRVGRGTAISKVQEEVCNRAENLTFPPAFLFSQRLVPPTLTAYRRGMIAPGNHLDLRFAARSTTPGGSDCGSAALGPLFEGAARGMGKA